jgi:hypothetical protein
MMAERLAVEIFVKPRACRPGDLCVSVGERVMRLLGPISPFAGRLEAGERALEARGDAERVEDGLDDSEGELSRFALIGRRD